MRDGVERVHVARNGDRPARLAVLVAEGWWHPNVKKGQVHDHAPEGSGYPTYHRECEQVWTMRTPATRKEFDDLEFGDDDE